MWGDLLFVPMRSSKGSHGKITTQAGHAKVTTRKPPASISTDTNKRPCPHALSPHKHTCSHILALQNRFVSCSLSNPPTHGNQQGTHAVDQKEDKALCRKSELMSRASYCATTQTLLHVLLINEAGVRPCRTNANFSFLNGQYRLIVQTRAITD